MAAEYNGTTDKADTGYSSGVEDLNIFYDVSLVLTTNTNISLRAQESNLCK